MSPDTLRSPKVEKGALVAISSDSPDPAHYPISSLFGFQYNPDKLTRTLTYPGDETLTGFDKTKETHEVPIEIISLTLELDASDNLEKEQELTVKYGLHPSLAALESLMYLDTSGDREEKSFVVFFIWGGNRILPVRLLNMVVSEEAFDPVLNPIRAKIDLSMKVLGRSDLMKSSSGYNDYETYLNQKGALALLYRKHLLDHKYSREVSRGIHQYMTKKTQIRRKEKS